MSARKDRKKEKKNISASQIRRPSITLRQGLGGGRHVEPVGRLNPSASFRVKNKIINLLTNLGVVHQTNEPGWKKKKKKKN